MINSSQRYASRERHEARGRVSTLRSVVGVRRHRSNELQGTLRHLPRRHHEDRTSFRTRTLDVVVARLARLRRLPLSRVGEIPTKTVSYRDLDLSTTPSGAEALYERIAAAAREVCRGVETTSIHECRALAVDGASQG